MISQNNYKSLPLSTFFHDLNAQEIGSSQTQIQEKVEHAVEGKFKAESNVERNLVSHSKTTIGDKQKKAIMSVSEILSDRLLDPNEKQKKLLDPVLREDLMSQDHAAIWLSKLFKGISPSLWHLVFIYFSTEILFKACGFFGQHEKDTSPSLDKMEPWPRIVTQSVQNLLNEEMNYFNITILKQILLILTKKRSSDGLILIGQLNFSKSLIAQLLSVLKDFDSQYTKNILKNWMIGIYQRGEPQKIKLQRISNILSLCQKVGFDRIDWLDHPDLKIIQQEMEKWWMGEIEQLIRLTKKNMEEPGKSLETTMKINVSYHHIQSMFLALQNSKLLEEWLISMNTIEVMSLLKKILSAFARPAAL